MPGEDSDQNVRMHTLGTYSRFFFASDHILYELQDSRVIRQWSVLQVILVKQVGALHRPVVVRHLGSQHGLDHLDYSPIFVRHVYPKLDKFHDAMREMREPVTYVLQAIQGYPNTKIMHARSFFW